jgi:hypothetical protein
VRENVVVAVMVYRKDVGSVFGVYLKAEIFELKRQCIESVKLPRLTEGHPEQTGGQIFDINVAL